MDGQFSTAVPPDPQPYILRNLKSGTKYQVALRLRVGNTYRQGYEPPTSPEDWPDTESRLEFTTSSITPSAPVVVWSREDSSTVKLTFEWGDADPTLPTRVVWSYDGLTWVELATAAPGENEADAVIDVPGTPEREKRVYFAVEHFSAVMAAGPQSDMVDEWTGPIQPVVTSLEWNESHVDEYTITWANLLPEAKTQISDNASGLMLPVPGSPFDPGVTSHTRGPISPEPDSELEIRLRYALPVPNSSLHDYSDWTVETITVPEDPDD